jgi:Flp pilus assembly protein TadD
VRSNNPIQGKLSLAAIFRWIAVAGLVFATEGCSTLPGVLASGNSLVGGLSQISSWSGKIATNFLTGSSAAHRSSEEISADDLIRAGNTVRGEGDFATAAWYYSRAVATDPKSVDAELQLGAANLALKDEEAAMRAYQAAQHLEPKNPEAAMRLGDIDLSRNAPSDALTEFAIALPHRKSDPALHNAVGVAWTMSGNYQLAQQEFNEGLRLRPEYPALINNYGLMQLRSGDLSGALATFSALTQSPQATDRYRINRALVELALGQTAAALADAPGMDQAALRQVLARYLPEDTNTVSIIDVHLETPVNAATIAASNSTDLPAELGGSKLSLLQ